MMRGIAVPLTAFPLAALAQADSQHLEGLRLFNQSCRVCHTKPQMTSPGQ